MPGCRGRLPAREGRRGPPPAHLRRASSRIHHHDAVDEAHDELDVVLDDQHSDTLAAERAQQVGQRLLVGTTEAGGRFVEHDQCRVGGERASDFQDALPAERQVAGWRIGVGAEPNPLELAQRLARALASSARSRRSAPSEKTSVGARIGSEQHVVENAHARRAVFTCWKVRAMPAWRSRLAQRRYVLRRGR